MALHDGEQWESVSTLVRRVPMSLSRRRTIVTARVFHQDAEYRWSKIAKRVGRDVNIMIGASADVRSEQWVFDADIRVRGPRTDTPCVFMCMSCDRWEEYVGDVISRQEGRVVHFLFAFLFGLHRGTDDD